MRLIPFQPSVYQVSVLYPQFCGTAGTPHGARSAAQEPEHLLVWASPEIALEETFVYADKVAGLKNKTKKTLKHKICTWEEFCIKFSRRLFGSRVTREFCFADKWSVSLDALLVICDPLHFLKAVQPWGLWKWKSWQILALCYLVLLGFFSPFTTSMVFETE